MNNKKKYFFTENLLRWDRVSNRRAMPWKGEKDPYKIWLSEIILQQTRVEQGLDYYNRFIKQFPSVKKLASAPESAVFKLWEGLGYYTRCRNLVATARYISDELEGNFPSTHADILKLKGVGPYTAAAISSFAYNLPHAVVDGNVMRVLARYFGIETAIDSSLGKNDFNMLAQQLLPEGKAAKYNQAIMDFGATVCKPQSPTCATCPLQKKCTAYQQGRQEYYPVKAGKLVKKHRYFYYLLVSQAGKYFIRKRSGKDIWQNLHEFILVERKDPAEKLEQEIPGWLKQFSIGANNIKSISKTYRQQLTHQTIHGCFISIELKQPQLIEGYELISKTKMKKLAFPRFITTYFEEEKFF